MTTPDDVGFDLATARFTPEDLSSWPIEDLPAPGEDLTGTVLMRFPVEVAQRLQAVAEGHGRSVADEVNEMLRSA